MTAEVVPVDPQPAAEPSGRRRARRVGQLLQVAVVFLALAVAALALIPLALGLKGEVVLSGSMRPHFAVGDVNYIKAVPVAGISVGTVITFHAPDDAQALITHRVVARSGAGPSLVFRTRGDANPVADGAAVPASAVVGVEAFRVPKLGRAALWIRTRQHYGYVGGGLFLLVVLYEGRTVLSEARLWWRRRASTRTTAGQHQSS